ncbi:kinetochore-associated protein 1-like isoform X2 [Lytechinus variegatus]|uniref:kinetochore-associated protein 1-like isoform X2 n=1 Tax=Lytechinus variegatus TaxID=7654 RepID=UPI001BB2303A|nr:kinetochore-associated protein 1-like isoform X2 [Lytechinus variegatus]
MSWDVIALDFGGEETANFGTRQESGTALFQVQTLATISNSNQEMVNKLPHVTASSSQSQSSMCVTADRNVSLFNDGCQVLNGAFSFDSVVELAVWVNDLPFLIIAERNGTVHVYHSGLHRILMSQKLVERNVDELDKVCFKQIKMTEDEEGKHSILLLASQNVLYRLSNVDMKKLHDVIQKGDLRSAKDLQGQIALDEIDLSHVHQEGSSDLATIVLGGHTHLVTVGRGDYVMAIWKCQSQISVRRRMKTNMFIAGEQLINCVVSGKYIFTLDVEHKLCCWNSSLILVCAWPLKVRDFFLTADNNNNSETRPQFQLVMLTVPNKNESYLKVYDLPKMHCTYTLSVGPVSMLADTPNNQDSIFLVEGRNEDEDESSLVSMLMIRCLMEALPETRFHRLLHKKEFEEAEKFAKLFSLDTELVYRSKALALLEQASSWSPANLRGSPLDDQSKLCEGMIGCLEKIADVEFVVDVCSKAAMPAFEDTARILQYARVRLSKVNVKDEMQSKIGDLLSMILDTLHRLTTFSLVYGSSEYSPTSWDAFLSGSLLNELFLHLSRANLGRASVIWNRHKEDFVAVMSEDLLEDMLRSIPGDSPSNDIIPWLRNDIIPYVCHSFQQGKKVLISWIEERVTSLEVTEKVGWPSNGLELAEMMLKGNQQLLKIASGIHFSQALTETNDSDCKDSMNRLKELVHNLQELRILHTRYKCFLTLDQFCKETTESISFRMLERVAAPELVPGTITKCIIPYAKDHKLEVDNLLLKYIEDLLSVPSLFATYEASWEAKAITVIRCIKDLTSQCGAILALMQKAPVPWSKGMEQLVQYGLSLKHPMVAKLEEHHGFMKLRDMFMKYDLRSVSLGDADSMKLAVKNILSRDGPTVLEDALRVVKAQSTQHTEMDAYLFRLQYLIKSNQVEKCLSLLSELPHQEALRCLSRILSWAKIVLDNPAGTFCDEQAKDCRVLVGQAAIRLLQTDLYSQLNGDPAQELLRQEELQSILYLQLEYNLLVPLSSYRDDAFRLQLLKKAIVDHYKEIQTGIRKKENCGAVERKYRDLKAGNFVRVLRLGEILGVSTNELRGEIALKAAHTGEINTAISICSDLCDPYCSPEVAYTLYQVSHAVCFQLASGHDIMTGSSAGDLFKQLLNLAQVATAYCNPELLADCFDLSTKIRSLKDLCDQCESGDYGISVQIGAAETKKDPYEEYTLETFFKEDSLVLSSQDIIPVAAEFALSCQPTVRPRDALPYQQARVSGSPLFVQDQQKGDIEGAVQSGHIGQVASSTKYLCQQLKEHNQCCLAFHYVMELLATSLVHLSVNSSNQPLQDEATIASFERALKELSEVDTAARQNIGNLSSILLNKIFSCREVDTFLALCYLIIQPSKELVKKLVYNAGQNYKKILAIAQVGYEMAKMNQDLKVQVVFQDLATSALWGDRLLKIKVSFKDAFNNMEKKRQLLPQLITHPETSLELITEYCRDFKLDEQEPLMMYVRLLLLPSDCEKDHHGNSKTSLDKKVILSAVSMIKKKTALYQMLKANVDKIDCYDYEMLRLVLGIINDSTSDIADQTHSTEVGLQLLNYLEAYTRRKPPSEYEIMFQQSEEDEGLMLTTKPLSPLSKTRLPFHPLLKGGQWKILCRELSEDTLGELLPIAEVLRLSTDQLYVTTIQNIIKARNHQGKKDLTDTDGGDEKGFRPPCKLDMDTLVKVKNILLQVKNPEMAVVTARFIAKELQVGKQKEMALKMCERLASRWQELSEEGTPDHQKACVIHQRLVAELRAVCTEEALRRHGLAEPQYTQMIATPAKLIFKLYEHPSIEQRMQGYHLNLPDINTAVEEIAKINNSNLEKIRIHLMEQWMPQPATSKQEDTTMNFNFDSSVEDEIPEGERSLMRLKYLLQRQKPESTILFLLNVAFKQTSTHVTTGCQVRALRCLFSLSDDDIISKVSKLPVSELREYLKNLVYLSEFEALNIAMDISTFTSSNKASLVRGLWKNHNHEPRSVRLIAELCLEYEIHDIHLWNSMLQQIQKFGMLDYLEYVLVEIAGLKVLRSVQCLPKVWSIILATPFMSICTPLTEEQAQRCRNVLSLVQKCPVPFDLDFIRLSCQFLRVDMHAEALACLLHIPDKTKRDSQIDMLLDTRHVIILDSLSHLMEIKQPLPEHEHVLTEVYRHTSSKGMYETLLGTKHFMGLVHHLAKQDQLQDLIRKTIGADRIPDAIKLVNVFHFYYPVSPSAHGSTGIELLKVYLTSHSMDDEAMNIVNMMKEEDSTD